MNLDTNKYKDCDGNFGAILKFCHQTLYAKFIP